MRRIPLLLALLTGLAVPATVLAAKQAPNDGTLVVKHGSAPTDGADKAPVVRLQITGSVIGQVVGQGRVIIDQTPKSPLPEVTGAAFSRDSTLSDTAKVWVGDADGFKFRAVGGTYTIVIFGSDVNLVAVGSGTIVLTGEVGSTTDGKYSLNGDDFKSLPGVSTKPLVIGTTTNG
jgi:hypothetical protein